MNLVLLRLPKAAITIWCGCAFLHLAGCADAAGASPASARVTRVINKVSLQSGSAVAVDQPVTDGSAIRTGANSRVEMKSGAGAITRLGANTVCEFQEGTRSLTLHQGVMLFQVPPTAVRATVRTGGITIETAGTTGILERHSNAYVKLLLLEGTARAYLSAVGESVLVEAGQILIMKPGAQVLPEPAHFDIERLYRTSLLTNNDFAPLASWLKIAAAIQKQRTDAGFTRTNLVIYGRGTNVTVLEPAAASGASGQPRQQRLASPVTAGKSRPN
ncbi:MAG TPA: FecR domain-containing protein [Chthoniobacterales bacterium]|nr:FecR domain-containing protein [Chthoniobacterales bacterium]